MPELPEVETIKNDLNKLVRDSHIVSLRVRKVKLLKPSAKIVRQSIYGKIIKRVERRGKLLVLRLSGGKILLIHLKMTGQLIWRPTHGNFLVGGHPIVGVSGVPNRFTHLTIYFKSGARLYFNDVRQFGYWQAISEKDLPKIYAKFGPEPLSKEFTKEYFWQSLKKRSRTTIKAVLLDQKVVAGIGNIYADESLFLAKIRPARRIGTLNKKKIGDLYKSIQVILARAIVARGTSFNSYIDGRGRQGTYWEKRLVYGRKSEKCRHCHNVILKTIVAGRGTHYCPKCQE
jgi:formamidopyrimidine-DNA glycosylase